MREERPLTPCNPSRPLSLSKLPTLQRGGRLGKRAQKAYAGTIKRAPEDATVKARVTPGARVRVIPNTPGEFDRIQERGMAVPS